MKALFESETGEMKSKLIVRWIIEKYDFFKHLDPMSLLQMVSHNLTQYKADFVNRSGKWKLKSKIRGPLRGVAIDRLGQTPAVRKKLFIPNAVVKYFQTEAFQAYPCEPYDRGTTS